MKNEIKEMSLNEIVNISGGGEWSNMVVEFLTFVGEAYSNPSKSCQAQYGRYAGSYNF
jgi:hypothetical protein